MSSAARPSGRLPARVYWMRRLTLLTVIVLALVWGSRQVTDPQPDPDASGSSAAAEPESEAPGDGTVSRRVSAVAAVAVAVSTEVPTTSPESGAPGSSAVEPSLADPTGSCDPAATTAGASAPDPLRAGSGAVLQVRLRTTAAAACTLSLEKLLVQVARDEEAVWRLSDCPSALTEESVVLHPGWSTVVDVAWSGRASNATCGLETRSAAPGTYQVQAAMLFGEPGSSDFKVLPDAD